MVKPTVKWLIFPEFVILAAPGWISLYLHEEPKLPEVLKMSEIKKMVINLMASGEVKAIKLGGGPTAPVPAQQLTAQEMATLVQIIRTCVQSKWNILGGGDSAEHTEVKMRLRFKPDGTLAAPPQITNPSNTPYFLKAAESAVRAVQQCEPFPLPAPKYDVWKDMIMTFKRSDMF